MRARFYAWLTRPRSQRSRSDEELGVKVRASFLASDRTSAPSPQRIREGVSRSTTAGLVGHSATATLNLFQERGGTFRDGVVDRIVLGLETFPDLPQPWASAQDVATLG
jgi:hypothetical protein